jgi:c-di-GMP-binding flagellar brake protein YcgR
MNHRSESSLSLRIPAAVGTGESAVGVGDRRRFPRVPYRATIEIRPRSDQGAPIIVVLQDLSATGMGVIHSCALCVGERYDVPLMRGDADEPSFLLCTVMRCEQLDDDLFSIGFEFDPRSDSQSR